MAAYDSLQQSVTGEILSPNSLLKFANSEIPGIQSFLVPITKVLKNKHLLEKRLEKSNSLPGSRSDHFFRASSDSMEIPMFTWFRWISCTIQHFKFCDSWFKNWRQCCFYLWIWLVCRHLFLTIDNRDVYVNGLQRKMNAGLL